jgi:hypothetical protein
MALLPRQAAEEELDPDRPSEYMLAQLEGSALEHNHFYMGCLGIPMERLI